MLSTGLGTPASKDPTQHHDQVLALEQQATEKSDDSKK